MELIDLFQADQILKDVNLFDKSLAEKLSFIEGLDKKDKIAFYAVLDAFVGKKKLKDALSNVLSDEVKSELIYQLAQFKFGGA